MPDDLKQQREHLGARIDALRKASAPRPVKGPPIAAPTTLREATYQNDYPGRLNPTERTFGILFMIGVLLLLQWLWPA
ncbi:MULTISPECIES: hypothetical protein [Mesorhizobium]|uniref:hypothetical protein n=1 Tax=Mesorhizobium TaxID=68287 RepID=UPI0010A96A41|nr:MULTISPECIES: hypothetical protein [Mesorhizobium]